VLRCVLQAGTPVAVRRLSGLQVRLTQDMHLRIGSSLQRGEDACRPSVFVVSKLDSMFTKAS